MDKFEKLKRKYLIRGLDDAFGISSLILDIKRNFLCKSELQLQTITLELVYYFLRSELFIVGELCDSQSIICDWALTIPNTIKKLKALWDRAEFDEKVNKEEDYVFYFTYFMLTEKGEALAQSYLEQRKQFSKNILLAALDQSYLSIQAIRELAKKEFKSEDEEELSFETLLSIEDLYLPTNQLIELGHVRDKQFIAFEGFPDDHIEKLMPCFYRVQPVEYYESLSYRLTPYAVKLLHGDPEILDSIL